MALVKDATCPECVKVFPAVVTNYEYGRRNLVKVCASCEYERAHKAHVDACAAATQAAHDKFAPEFGSEFAELALNTSALGVVIRRLCGSRPGKRSVAAENELKRFWDEVRAEVEKT